MKPLSIIGLFLFALAACVKVPEPVEGPTRNNTPSPELQSIDTQMWHHPDSALMRLLPWFDTCCRDAACHVSTATEYNRHYAHLLLSELLYKNDYPQTNRMELQQVVGYFDSLTVLADDADTRGVSLRPRPRRDARRASAQNIAFLDARAHYINGVGYYERDSVVEACKEYYKALEVMEEHFEEKKMLEEKARFMAITHIHLAQLFSNLYLHEQALCFFKLALKSYKSCASEDWHIAWIMNMIGAHYDMLEDLDSANYYYTYAANAINDSSTLMYRDIAVHLAILQYKKHRNSTEPMNRLYDIISNSENDEEYYARCSVLGELFYLEKQYDSAWKYLRVVFQNTNNVNSKRQVAVMLVDICNKQERDTEVPEFANFLAPFANQEENQSSLKSQLTESYKVFCQTKLEEKYLIEAKRRSTSIVIFIIVMLLVVLVITVLYYQNKRRKQELEFLIETERQAHKTQQSALAGRLKQSNAALKQKMEPNRSIDGKKEPSFTSADDYVYEPICQHILAICNDKKNPVKSTVPIAAYAQIALTDAQKAKLKVAASHHYGHLFKQLGQDHPELKEKDYFYCYLCLLGLDNVQIAALLQKSVSTIWEREKRLQKILGSDNRIAIILNNIIIN